MWHTRDMEQVDDIVLVTIGCASEEEALRLSKALVDEKLVACANAYPVQSTYDWKGERVVCEEVCLELKTIRSKVDAIEKRVGDLHSYEVPGILVVPIEQSNVAFAAWVREQTS